MDELLEQEGGEKLQLLLNGGDETDEKNVVKFNKDKTQQQDSKRPKPILPPAETEMVCELSQPVSSKQPG